MRTLLYDFTYHLHLPVLSDKSDGSMPGSTTYPVPLPLLV